MRGLVPARIMAAIEEKTGLHMADMVDVFAGPSTGAILNAALNIPHDEAPTRPKYRARHMVKFYEREGPRIFPPDRFRDFRALIHDFNNRTMKISQLNKLLRHGHYNPGHLSWCLNALYGDHKLSNSLRDLIIPVYNIDGKTLKAAKDKDESDEAPVHTINNFVNEGGHALWLNHIRSAPQATTDVRIQDAVLGSCAAPSYFPCHHFTARLPGNTHPRPYTGIDGSIFDNPPISYHGAIRRHLKPSTRTIMILLGTGFALRSFDQSQWNSYGGLGIVDPVNDLPLINILFHAPESALVEGFIQEIGRENLFVFNNSLIAAQGRAHAPSLQIDDASPENLKNLAHFAEATIEDNKAKLDALCNLLTDTYAERQKKTWWRF